ncbi:unnamed protein product [Tuber melanosporum]|uniref:(Perigord truffle) hypothetical protein n=1 Tax=Tuber melanosporum (strain Mel28) TaxID=656061 RepID=D5GE50_TUBMM|nr:uncharacterized protein GSTUM_00006380001 [Tuber melanosporum]CAZ82793.1 unnamed protein product [Tuber melanosporum]
MAGNRQSLTKGLERKVLAIVRRYIDELSVAGEKNGPLRLSVSQVFQYVITDESVPRQKKQNLEKMIEKALDTIRDEEAEADSLDSDLSEFEELNEEGFMEPKESNTMNKRVVNMWSTSTSSTTTPKPPPPIPEIPPPIASNTVPESPAPRKRKGRQPVKDSESAKRQKQDDSREPPKNISLKDIGGLEDVINDLLELIAMPLTHPEVYLHTGVQPPRGVLLHGPPGCGKTMLANAVAGEIGLPFIAISAPSIVSGMSGESEKKLRELFEEAREKAPCLIFMDEIDAITPKRESAQREMERRIVAQMLTCMDDLTLEKTSGKPVMIIGATNRPDSLDPALRRAGRFDREICLNVPDEVGREKILRVLCQKLRLSGDFDFKRLAKTTPGFVGADLNALTAEAGAVAMRRIYETLIIPPATIDTLETKIQLDSLHITLPDFLTALPKIQPSSKREGFATVPDVTWADIGALESLRVEMQMAIVQPIKRPELFARVGVTAPAGVLLWGPPGCGKTLLAKAVANESRANFISIRGPELLNKYVGESERAVRQVFTRARASIPCVIFFDELDALVPRRNDSLSESSSRVVNTLLTELDGLNDRKGIYVIGATNRPDVIDPAMLRPGRLDKPLFVDLPNTGERVEILKIITKNTPLSNVDLGAIAVDNRCKNFSGADLAALVREAAVLALRHACFTDVAEVEEGKNADNLEVMVTMEDFEKAFVNIRPSVSEDDREQYQELATRFGWGKTVLAK